MFERCVHNGEAEPSNNNKNISELQRMVSQERFERIYTQHIIATKVRVAVYFVGVYMVLHYMLMDPINCRAANPILRHTKHAIYERIARNSAMIRVVLNVESD